MKIRKHWMILVVGLAMLALAACTGATQEIPETGAEGTPALPAKAVLDAQAWLAEQTGVEVAQVEILSSEQVDWSDSCLGLGGPAESCAAVVTPGWQVVFRANGEEYTVRTDETGSVIRSEDFPEALPLEDAPEAGANPLTGTSWTLESFGAAASGAVVEGTPVTLQFGADGQAGGSSGCNTFGGPFTVENGTLNFGDVVSTLMACDDQAVMEQETAFLSTLATVRSYEVDGSTLNLLDESGQPVLTFTQAP